MTITSFSNRAWIERHPLKLHRYLRRSHKLEDRPTVFDLVYNVSPDEGRKLIENFDISEENKLRVFLSWIIFQPQITCLIFADQRYGKDAFVGFLFDLVISFYESIGKQPPRFVTLGNIRKPPMVAEDDMYFSFKKIPAGSKDREVWIYCSEIETVLPAREGLSTENRLFSQLEGTMAQNHQKLFGCCKLASKVDINAIRGCNVKCFKFISPEKLGIEGVERINILSPLGLWLLPKNREDKSEVLLAFDNQFFTIHHPLPTWWSDEYSEQFRDVPMDKIEEYVETLHSNGLKPPAIKIAVAQKFRKELFDEDILRIVKFGDSNGDTSDT